MSTKSVEAEGRTIDEAIAQGLATLGVQRDRVEVEVLEEAAKGLFGLFGSKAARVRLTLKDTPEQRAMDFIGGLTPLMGAKGEVTVKSQDEDTLLVEVAGENMGALIGHRGETLDALQYLTSIVVNRGRSSYLRVLVNTEGYREKREESLRRLAEKLANKALRTRRRVVLEPMSPYERRVIHFALQDFPGVTTLSEGEEPRRHLVIIPD